MGAFDRVLDAVFYFRTPQQFLALYRKNALVAWRNRRATALRIFAPFLFLLLALLIDRALQANEASNTDFQEVTNPDTEYITAIPSCTSDIFIGDRPCKELLYTPTNTITDLLMQRVTAANSIPITADGLPTRAAAQAYLLDNPDTVIAAVHFEFIGATLEGFILQTNTTPKFFKGNYQDPNTFVQLPVQVAVQREIARYVLEQNGSPVAPNLEWTVGLKEFAHPTIATTSVLGQVLGPFIFAACMFGFVIQISAIVAEKELGLKQALRTMGMTDTAYWLSWAMWEVTLSFVVAHSICIFGLILQFRLFLKNNYGLLFFLFFLFQLAMASLAMLLSTLIRKTQTAVYLGFVVFIVGWIMQTVVIFGVPYTPDYYTTANGAISAIFSLFPWDLLAKGFNDLGSATVGKDSPGLRWSQRSSYCQDIPNTDDQPAYNPKLEYRDYECVMPMNLIYGIFIICWIGYFALAMYFDAIMPNEFGVRRPFYFLFAPSYWCPGRVNTSTQLHKVEKDQGHHVEDNLDEDVKEEEIKMQSLLQHRTGKPGALSEQVDKHNAVEVYGLQKLYKGQRGCCGSSLKCCACCEGCSCLATSDFWAIKGSWFSIEENQLFCLLGPNGAGKTTTINALTGVIPPTAGEALVYGEAISSPGGLDRIRSMMGVCPQFDILWNELTGLEHLQIYGHVKGLPWRKVKPDSTSLLEKVKLTYAGAQRSGSYSGGMKRRLSVAIALLGDPKIVYLDEPTTGMDPISRRYVWDIIQEAKVGRAIVLTTHSMEEADILGDRIAIMARGKLRCLGTALHLKQRFGAGYQVSVSVMPSRTSEQDMITLSKRAERVKEYFKTKLGLTPVDESKAYIEFLVARAREPELITFLQQLEADKASLGLTDIQLSLTSLEEVFLTIARNAELEAAASSGLSEVTQILEDGSELRIPLGAELVQHPITGTAYRVRWGTDDEGKLSVLDCKPTNEVPAQMPGSAGQPSAQYMGSNGQATMVAGGPGPYLPLAAPVTQHMGPASSRGEQRPPLHVYTEGPPAVYPPGYNPSPVASGNV